MKENKCSLIDVTPKTNWCLGLMIKSNHHGADAISSISIISKKKKKSNKFCNYNIGIDLL